MDPKQDKLEMRLSMLCRSMDVFLEEKFGSSYVLYPNRMKHGAGNNPCFDGLFATSIAFSLGYGSGKGRGYVVNIDTRTPMRVAEEVKAEIYDAAFDFLSSRLRVDFPERDLEIVRDGKLLKIVGDFSLDN